MNHPNVLFFANAGERRNIPLEIPAEHRHLERLRGEYFIGNCRPEEFAGLAWETKRLGQWAYDQHGKLVPQLRPVFVQIAEHEQMCRVAAEESDCRPRPSGPTALERKSAAV